MKKLANSALPTTPPRIVSNTIMWLTRFFISGDKLPGCGVKLTQTLNIWHRAEVCNLIFFPFPYNEYWTRMALIQSRRIRYNLNPKNRHFLQITSFTLAWNITFSTGPVPTLRERIALITDSTTEKFNNLNNWLVKLKEQRIHNLSYSYRIKYKFNWNLGDRASHPWSPQPRVGWFDSYSLNDRDASLIVDPVRKNIESTFREWIDSWLQSRISGKFPSDFEAQLNVVLGSCPNSVLYFLLATALLVTYFIFRYFMLMWETRSARIKEWRVKRYYVRVTTTLLLGVMLYFLYTDHLQLLLIDVPLTWEAIVGLCFAIQRAYQGDLSLDQVFKLLPNVFTQLILVARSPFMILATILFHFDKVAEFWTGLDLMCLILSVSVITCVSLERFTRRFKWRQSLSRKFYGNETHFYSNILPTIPFRLTTSLATVTTFCSLPFAGVLAAAFIALMMLDAWRAKVSLLEFARTCYRIYVINFENWILESKVRTLVAHYFFTALLGPLYNL